MKERKIVKNLKNESKLMYANVFDRVLNEIGYEPPVKKPWYKRVGLVSTLSGALVTASLIGIIAINGINDSNNDEAAYINLDIKSSNVTANPSFSYALAKKNIATDFNAKNDDAKIIAEGINVSEQKNGTILTEDIIREANSTGYINTGDKSTINTINIFVSSLSKTKQDSVIKALNTTIENYCKNNYIYANITFTTQAIADENITSTKYKKIYELYELAQIFDYSADESSTTIDPYYPSSDINWWVEHFKNEDENKIQEAINKLSIINEALKTDMAKERFNSELHRAREKYLRGVEKVTNKITNIENQINDVLNTLHNEFKCYEYDNWEKEEIDDIDETFDDAWEWLLEIQDLDDYDDDEDRYRYDYDDDYRPFDDYFNYDYYYKQNHRFMNRHPNHDDNREPQQELTSKEDYINRLEDLLDQYDSAVEKYNDFAEKYSESKNCILANIYYQVKAGNNDYYKDYQKEYDERKDKHNHHSGPEWEDWVNNYDRSWWDD